MPDDGRPIKTSPSCKLEPVISFPFGSHPKAVPDRSSSLTIPGRLAVSPPARVTFALLHASANERPIA